MPLGRMNIFGQQGHPAQGNQSQFPMPQGLQRIANKFGANGFPMLPGMDRFMQKFGGGLGGSGQGFGGSGQGFGLGQRGMGAGNQDLGADNVGPGAGGARLGGGVPGFGGSQNLGTKLFGGGAGLGGGGSYPYPQGFNPALAQGNGVNLTANEPKPKKGIKDLLGKFFGGKK